MASTSTSSTRSTKDPTAVPRQSLTPSTDSESQPVRNTRRRKAARGKARTTSTPARQTTSGGDRSSVSDCTGPETGSRRDSTSSMHYSAGPVEPHVRYTPTTHRVSKARKGQRVHACAFPGCNKVSRPNGSPTVNHLRPYTACALGTRHGKTRGTSCQQVSEVLHTELRLEYLLRRDANCCRYSPEQNIRGTILHRFLSEG